MAPVVPKLKKMRGAVVGVGEVQGGGAGGLVGEVDREGLPAGGDGDGGLGLDGVGGVAGVLELQADRDAGVGRPDADGHAGGGGGEGDGRGEAVVLAPAVRVVPAHSSAVPGLDDAGDLVGGEGGIGDDGGVLGAAEAGEGVGRARVAEGDRREGRRWRAAAERDVVEEVGALAGGGAGGAEVEEDAGLVVAIGQVEGGGASGVVGEVEGQGLPGVGDGGGGLGLDGVGGVGVVLDLQADRTPAAGE
jgi:hypothetical protein